MDIKREINEHFDQWLSIQRDFHQYPELSTCEFRTGEKICGYLDRWDIPYKKHVAETGIVGVIYGAYPGATVAIRADMDALPIEEQTQSPFSSKIKGVMHACGHDFNTTILLASAQLLRKMAGELHGNVVLLFQPAEEAVGGAKRMIEAGCLLDPPVDYAIGLHLMPNVPVGKVELKYGKLTGNSGNVRITVFGKSGHAAYPDTAHDAVVAAAYIITALQTLVSRSTSPLDSRVLTIGKISGGEKNNIIADRVVLSGTLRTLDMQSRSEAKQKIRQICGDTARALGTTAEVEFHDGYEELVNDGSIVDVIRETAAQVVGEENIVFKEFPSLGGEDFSYFAKQVKAAFFYLGCGNEEKKLTQPLHSKLFQADENCIRQGVEMHLRTVVKLMERHADLKPEPPQQA